MFFTGAGVSVGSGLPTYRGTDGIYTDSAEAPPCADDVTPARLPWLWGRYRPRIETARDVGPSAAHLAIAQIEQLLPDHVTVITQNVDGLHQLAGSTVVAELHGTLRTVRCLEAGHVHRVFGLDWDDAGVPVCPDCGAWCRPNVVLFGESLPSDAWHLAHAAIRSAATIVAVGTEATVYPAAHLIDEGQSPGPIRIWVNPETPPPAGSWTWLRGTADEQVPRLLA